MGVTVPRLCGEEWQKWANQLLAAYYGATEYQQVPDNHKGDAGIEGYTFKEGHAYQCYGCEEPISTSQRLTRQRNKLTEDIKKFINNRSIFTKLFGEKVKITRWVFFVPYFDSKELVSHATDKTSLVLSSHLPYVSKDFHVKVMQEDELSVQRQMLINSGLQKLKFNIETATNSETEGWANENSDLARTLEGKINKISTIRTEGGRLNFYQSVLKWYLDGQAIHEKLRSYPEIYQKVIRIKSQLENSLVITMASSKEPTCKLNEIISSLKSMYQEEISVLDSVGIHSLAHEAIADWLLRCPLDFEEELE